ncbi:hypothetical protein P4O66_011862 [Electrophorus voltai]|uniref:ribonuclease H n=1 Tax=Electrophorus voltai TaxID=2609070 RepID=A0AAD8Z8Z5_9TELE|nr:hypothetical protein P4O66_011862 [Electrophorus voltai]
MQVRGAKEKRRSGATLAISPRATTAEECTCGGASRSSGGAHAARCGQSKRKARELRGAPQFWLPWLKAHNRHLQWTENRFLELAVACEGKCLPQQMVSLQSTSIDSPKANNDLTVPQEYSDLAQAYINEVLREYLGRSVITYIDDILIYSSSWDQHMHDVWAVLHTLLQNHLYCKLEKCEFIAKSMVARPLTDLHCKAAKRLKWGTETEKSFTELKETFSTALVLQQLDPRKPFMVEVAASDVGTSLFTRFKFLVTYRPGERNMRANTLSWQHLTEA